MNQDYWNENLGLYVQADKVKGGNMYTNNEKPQSNGLCFSCGRYGHI